MSCPRQRGDLLAEHRTLSGWWSLMCPICNVSRSIISKDYDEALDWFWEKHDSRNKETSMSTADYKRGVEDALAELDTLPKVAINYVRKKLLTKKVTKWFLVYDNGNSGNYRISGQYVNPWNNEGTGKAILYDSKEEALSAHTGITIVGAFPVEIEVEI